MKKNVFVISVFLIAVLCACGKSAATWQEQYDMGLHYLSEGNYAEAILAFTAAIELDPEQAPAYVGRGDAYSSAARLNMANAAEGAELSQEAVANYESALADYLAALDLDNSDVSIYKKAADIYIQLGDTSSAIALLEEGADKTGAFELTEYLKSLSSTSDHIGAIDQKAPNKNWKSVIQDAEKIVFPVSRIDGLTYEQMHHIYDPLILDLEEYIAANPENADGYKCLSQIYCYLNQLDKCLDIRTAGYSKTKDEMLKPEEHTISTDFGTVTYYDGTWGDKRQSVGSETFVYDAWGREIRREVNNYVTITEYGNEMKKEISQNNNSTMEYIYENGRLISRIYHYGDNDTRYDTWEYPDNQTRIFWSYFIYSDGYQTRNKKANVTIFNEYGEVLQRDIYDDRTGELSYSEIFDERGRGHIVEK